MANFTALKTAINNAIKTNGNEEITGAVLQVILDAMVETLGESAITNLENALSDEIINRQNAVSGVADDLAAEALARAAKDNQLDGRINQEEYNRANADAALSQTMSQGFQTLGSQMTALNAAISALNTAYQNGYLYGGIATPSSSPSNGKCFYIALQGGTYTNFGGVGVVEGINIIKNDSGWKVEHIYDQTTLLNEFYLLRQQVIRALAAVDPIVIQGDVTNAPDEEDLTSNAQHLLKFKDRAYSPLNFSGLGMKILRKNILPLSDSAAFNGFIEGVTAEETLAGTPELIFWDRMNTRFIGIKDGIYYAAWTDDDNYVPVSTSLVYTYNGTPYQWTGSDFIVDETEVPNLVNCLTQDMINEANTIYIIRYDYTLKENITIPANCVLEFDGGSISGEHTITGANTGIQAGLVKIFSTNVTLAGTWNVTETYSEWFGAKADGITDSTAAIIAALNFIKPTGGNIKLLKGTYLTSPIDLTGFKNICISGYNDADSRPWIAQTTLKIVENGEVGIRLVPDYDKAHDAIPVKTDCCGYSKIQNIFLDCNHNTNKGINANWNIIFENIEVRNSNGDGIVLEADSYPVTLNHVHSSQNGGHGLSILGPNTTSIFINDFDASYNGLYGMYMEAGNACLFNNVFLQYNDVGGLKIIRKDSLSNYPYYFGFVDFTNLYTEDNGKYLDSDAKFEGNCAVLIQGDNLSPTSFVGKVNNVRFYNCIFNKSLVQIDGTPVNSVGFKCEGAAGILLSGCNVGAIDDTKNIPATQSQIISSGITFGHQKPYLKDYRVYKNTQNIFTLYVGSSSTVFPVNSCYVLGSKIGHQVNITVRISVPVTSIDNNNFVYFKLSGLHVESYVGVYSTDHIVGKVKFGANEYRVYASENNLYTDARINDIKVGGIMYISINTLFFEDE